MLNMIGIVFNHLDGHHHDTDDVTPLFQGNYEG
jgi:hypothetical protein